MPESQEPVEGPEEEKDGVSHLKEIAFGERISAEPSSAHAHDPDFESESDEDSLRDSNRLLPREEVLRRALLKRETTNW